MTPPAFYFRTFARAACSVLLGMIFRPSIQILSCPSPALRCSLGAATANSTPYYGTVLSVQSSCGSARLVTEERGMRLARGSAASQLLCSRLHLRLFFCF